MRREALRWWLVGLAAGCAAVGAVRADCTDADGDGWFAEESCGAARDCNDGDPGTYPGALELCDGRDNDCNGKVDEGRDCASDCPLAIKAGDDLRVTFVTSLPSKDPRAGFAVNPALTWHDRQFGLAWAHYGRTDLWVEAALLDDAPRVQAGVLVAGNAEQGSGNRALVSLGWTGREFGLAYNKSGNTMELVRYGPLVDERSRSDANLSFEYTRGLAHVWNGGGYGVAWAGAENPSGDRSMVVHFLTLDESGHAIGADQEIGAGTSSCEDTDERRCVSLVWTGQEYGLAWQALADGNSEIFFARADTEGRRIGPAVRLTVERGASVRPVIAWDGSEYGVLWQDDRDGLPEIYFAKVDTEGRKVTEDIRLTDPPATLATWPWLVWTGTRYAFLSTRRIGLESGVYLEQLEPDGKRLGAPVRVTSRAGSRPSAVWTGTRFGVAWSVGEIFFSEVGCSRIDIEPRIATNVLNLRSHGIVPVAILGSSSVDVRAIEPSSLRLGPWSAPPEKTRFTDVNRDGLPDLQAYFRLPRTGIACGDTTAVLSGVTRSGAPFSTVDTIATTGCR